MQANWKHWLWGEGRATRREYWTVILLTTLGAAVIHAALAMAVLSAPDAVYPATAAILIMMAAVGWLVVCAASRRLHDLGHSGWWQVTAIGLGTVGAAVMEPAWSPRLGLDETTAALVALPFGAAANFFFIAIGVVRTKSGENRFGPPPA